MGMTYDPFKPTKTQRIGAGLQLIGLVLLLLAIAVIVLVVIGLLISLAGLDLLPGDAIENLVGSVNTEMSKPCDINCQTVINVSYLAN